MAVSGPASAGTALAMLSPRSAVPSASSSVRRGPVAAPAPWQALGLPVAAREGTQAHGNTACHSIAIGTVAAAAATVWALRPSKRGKKAQKTTKTARTRPVPWNIYSPKTPLKAKLTKNFGVPRHLHKTEMGDEEICHLTFDHGGAYFFVEGQVVGVMTPSADPDGESPASMKFFSVASSPRGDDQTSRTMSICVKRTEKPPTLEKIAEHCFSNGYDNGQTAPSNGNANGQTELPEADAEAGAEAATPPSGKEVEKAASLKGEDAEKDGTAAEEEASTGGTIPELAGLKEMYNSAKERIPEVEKLEVLLATAKSSIPEVEKLDAIFKNFLRTVGIDDTQLEKEEVVPQEPVVEEVVRELEVKEVRTITDLCDLESGDEVIMTGPTGVQEMLLPEDPQANLVMIATGTGIAPMRSYCRTLFHDMEGLDSMSGKRKFKGLAWLLYGAPSEKSLLYHDEHLGYAAAFRENFRYDYAAPSDESAGTLSALREKVYLYHEVLWTLLQDEQTHLVVSGVRGIEELLREALNPISIENGSDWYLLRETLIKEGRYHVEEH